jgi:SAM-dependent methyltransferase
MTAPAIDAKRFREFERHAHDRLADSYRSFFVPITEHAAEPLLDAVSVRNGMRILDVATGSGVVAAHAVARGAVVTGVDISPRMVALAAQLSPDCTFREASVESLPFDDASFDAVVCAFGIGHFPDSKVALAECVRVLITGGRLACAWWDTPTRNRLHGVLLEAIQEADAKAPADLPVGPPMFRYSEDSEFAALLASTGLEHVNVTPHIFTYRVPTADVLWTGVMGSLARTSALLAAQMPDVQRRIKSAFDVLVNAYRSPQGIDLPIAFKTASGRKC